MRLRKDTRGMTLVEAIAGITVLVLASLMILTGFSVVMKLIRDGEIIQQSGQLSAAVVDGAARDGVGTQKETGSAAIRVQGGKTITVDGPYQTFTEGDGPDSFFRVFGERGGLRTEVRLAQDLYELTVDTVTRWSEIWPGLTEEDKNKAGLKNSYPSNDKYRQYIFYLQYGENWNLFPEEALPTKENGNPLFNMPLYMECYTCEKVNGNSTAETRANNVIVYATIRNTATASWWAYLIYMPEEKQWYYQPDGKYIMLTDYRDNGGVAQLRQQMQKDGWVALK